MTGVSGLNVVDVNGNINLNNASLQLSGPTDAVFVVNNSGSITLVGTGGIKVAGSVSPGSLLISLTGTGSKVNTHVGNFIQGTLLDTAASGTLDGSFGSLLLGQDFTLMSGATVTFQGCPTPPTFTCPPDTFWSDLNGDGLMTPDECFPDINS